jgi:oxygen-independent coproporphyrinogen-3 oxidase
MPTPKGVYIHIPFCLSKCFYCDFSSKPLQSQSELTQYLWFLKTELACRVQGKAETVYFGGGTPSLCPAEEVQLILEKLKQLLELAPAAEITLEANPATLGAVELRALRRAGVNRLSLGVQSTSDSMLQKLGRRHSAADAEILIRQARQAGFDNVSCDLIFGLPGQGINDFKVDLEKVSSWAPEHLSLYALSVEEDTPLAREVRAGLKVPEDDLVADMYEEAQAFLGRQGYGQYELSNFSRKGLECRHNINYWQNGEYWGLGASAHSHVDGVRSWNFGEAREYIRAMNRQGHACSGSEALKNREKIAETLILGLRLTAGIEKDRIEKTYGKGWSDQFVSAFQEMEQAGLLMEDDHSLRLTTHGMFLSNVVFRAIL